MALLIKKMSIYQNIVVNRCMLVPKQLVSIEISDEFESIEWIFLKKNNKQVQINWLKLDTKSDSKLYFSLYLVENCQKNVHEKLTTQIA